METRNWTSEDTKAFSETFSDPVTNYIVNLESKFEVF